MTLVALGAIAGFIIAWLIRGWDVWVWETRTKQLEADWLERVGFPHWLPRDRWDDCNECRARKKTLRELQGRP